MQLIIIVAVGLLLNVAMAYASTNDLHWCTNCKATGSTEYGMRVTKGRKTLRNPRGLYYTHNGCVQH